MGRPEIESTNWIQGIAPFPFRVRLSLGEPGKIIVLPLPLTAGFRLAPTRQLSVLITVLFGQLAFGVLQIKGPDQMTLGVGYQSAGYIAIPKSFDDDIKRHIRAYR